MSSIFRRREQAARDRAAEHRSAARHDYVTLDEEWPSIAGDALLHVRTLADDDALGRHLQQLHDRASGSIAEATTAVVEAERSHDPGELSGREAVEQAEARWQVVRGQVDAAHGALADLRAAVADVDARQRWCEGTVAGVTARLSDAEASIATAREQGFDVQDLEATVSQVVAAHRKATAALDGARLVDAHTILMQADADLTRCTVTARGLSTRQQELLAGHAAVREALSDASVAVQQLSTAVTSLRARFAETVWRSVDALPGLATEELAVGRAAVRQAANDASMQQQAFDAAADQLTRAQQVVDAVSSMHAAVQSLSRSVDGAIAEYPAAHDAAARSMAAARQFLQQRPADVNPALHDGMGQAGQVMAEAERMASTGRGDPFIALQLLGQVADYADRVLHSARTDTQRRDAFRVQVFSQLREGHRQVDRAWGASGMGITRRSKEMKRNLRRAHDLLAEAEAVLGVDPDRAHLLGSEALAIAHEVLSSSSSSGPPIRLPPRW